MSVEAVENRHHLRYTVNEPCTAYHGDGEYIGAVVNMSVSGAAIHLDVELDADSIVELQVQCIGEISTRMVRPLVGGFAVEFLFDPAQDRQLIARLWKALNEFTLSSDRPC